MPCLQGVMCLRWRMVQDAPPADNQLLIVSYRDLQVFGLQSPSVML